MMRARTRKASMPRGCVRDKNTTISTTRSGQHIADPNLCLLRQQQNRGRFPPLPQQQMSHANQQILPLIPNVTIHTFANIIVTSPHTHLMSRGSQRGRESGRCSPQVHLDRWRTCGQKERDAHRSGSAANNDSLVMPDGCQATPRRVALLAISPVLLQPTTTATHTHAHTCAWFVNGVKPNL